MKCNSKKRGGFTLIEIIISMAVIGIISLSVYNGFMIMIKQTKDGQVKQTSTLIGKQISEEIKSASESKEFTKSDTNFELTDKMNFIKDGDNYINTIFFDEDGKQINSKSRYTATIELNPKKAKLKLGSLYDTVSIDEIQNKPDIDKYNIYVIKEAKQVKVVNIKPDASDYINDAVTADIEIKNPISGKIEIGSSSLDHTFTKEKIQINIDLKYCTGLVTINVNNETKTPLNLCVLNNSKANVVNSKGILNEYYRSDSESKIGVLYDVNIKIDDEKIDKSKQSSTIFETSFVQNINTKDNLK